MHLAQRLEQLALARRIPVYEPFAGSLIGPFTVLSPNRSWYVGGLLPAFGTALPRAAGLTLADLARWVRLAGAGIGACWDFEPLPQDPATRAEDESSVVLYGEFEGRGVLLTSNAGIRALSDACTLAEHLDLNLPSNLRLMQVPDQGNPDNLSSRVLDRLVGERQPPRTARRHQDGRHFRGPPRTPARPQDRGRRPDAPRRRELHARGHATAPCLRHARARLASGRAGGDKIMRVGAMKKRA